MNEDYLNKLAKTLKPPYKRWRFLEMINYCIFPNRMICSYREINKPYQTDNIVSLIKKIGSCNSVCYQVFEVVYFN